MSIFRSHLFPHIAFVSILAAVTFFGLTRLRRGLAETRETRRRHQHAWSAIQRCEQIRQRLRFCRSRIDRGDPPDRPPRRDPLFATEYDSVSDALSEAAADFAQLSEVHSRQLQKIDESFRELIASDLSAEEFNEEATQRMFVLDLVVDKTEEVARADLDALSKQLFEAENQFGKDAMLVFVLLVILALSYLYAVNWLLARPIYSLAATAREVTEGDLRARARANFDGPVSQLARDFNNMVDILVASLAEEEKAVRKLRVQARALKEANEHKSRFLANVSHELKTPLNAIIGFADILQAAGETGLTDQQRDYLNRIFVAGNHLLGMISDLIDLAKLDLDALNLKNEPCDLAVVAAEARDMMAAAVEKKGLELVMKAPNEVEATIDGRRVKQILINLLSNAIKFTREGGRIELSLDADDTEVVLRVRDNGIGISRANQKRIFEDFVQLDSALHRQHEGTGIGLTLTRRLVELMTGRLELESDEDKGSTFSVFLPRRLKVKDTAATKADAADRSDGGEAESAGPPLAADDSDDADKPGGADKPDGADKSDGADKPDDADKSDGTDKSDDEATAKNEAGEGAG